MNFSTRLGWSLVLFGLVALVAPLFGYVPRKLANLTPGQIKAVGVSIMVLGGLFLVLGRDPQVRRKVLLGLGLVTGLAVLLLVSAVVYGRFIRKRGLMPVPPPSSAWTPPTAPAAPASSGGASGGTVAASPMSALHEKRRAWESRHGRERVWSVVVHLAGTEPPADLERRLQGLFPNGGADDVVVARTGGLMHVALAPLEGGDSLRAALAGLFPDAEVQVVPAGRQVTVFVRRSGAAR